MSDTSIATEILTENNNRTIRTDDDDEDEVKTYKSETDNSRTSSRTTSRRRTNLSYSSFTTKPSDRKSNNNKTYNEDFETDQDITISQRRPDSSRRKRLSFAGQEKEFDSARSNVIQKDAEIQVNTNDLFKNSDLVRSLNIYNPSSLLLSSLAQFDQINLRDLNQITGYNMINHAFNDLFRANLNFVRNFLTTQRNMYESQMESIQPK